MIVNLVYNETDISLQLADRSDMAHVSLHILFAVMEYLLNIMQFNLKWNFVAYHLIFILNTQFKFTASIICSKE